MQRLRLLEEFNKFCRENLAPNCPEYMRRDMRISYMAGAAALFKIITHLSSQDLVVSQDVDMIKDIQTEIAAYIIDLREGRV